MKLDLDSIGLAARDTINETTPGNWRHHESWNGKVFDGGEAIADCDTGAEASFIASASPLVVLEMISLIRRQEKELKETHEKVLTEQCIARCMDLVRSKLIEAAIFDENVPPMLVSNAVVKAVQDAHKKVQELEAARFAYASEFPPNADGEPDVGSIHANIRKLKAERRDESSGIRIAIVDESDERAELMRRAATCDDPSQWVCISQGMSLDDAVAAVLGETPASLTHAATSEPVAPDLDGEPGGFKIEFCGHYGKERYRIYNADGYSICYAQNKQQADHVLKLLTAALAAPPAAQQAPSEPLMADGETKLSDYLESALPETHPMDEWTQGFEECRRRLFRIVGPQLRAALSAQQAGVQEAPRDTP